jgi:hypothetical protein
MLGSSSIALDKIILGALISVRFCTKYHTQILEVSNLKISDHVVLTGVIM